MSETNKLVIAFLSPSVKQQYAHPPVLPFPDSASVKLFVLPDRRRCRSASQFPVRHFTGEMMFPFLGVREPALAYIINNDDLLYALYPLADF
jgi:hypothetical protein